ncbi:SRPBCC family protein [Vibrio maritimus]|jgi:ribosome-associated toxin RatA of RatAB toxin-antitoxin module|uniref:Oligoketide cyclase/lipid transport protein n=3 Tax=Vibrio TaxID=662 RepID=A0ABQ0J4U1_9VIBR|nr:MULTISPECIES: SRPBCC family protein [Vibrio]USD61038.1 ubiquinone-binding protein [Vibrio sp. SCSIO 43140]GAL21657.1 putative oligoketide cyclase/lipid transport protein [Vibrio maritimus]GAL23755.1 putative oligoketide cyclase/lipid transport protein [Vibrio variabilis]GAL36117.1 putative oligoketide cyclase/lipid transport protein [Vibrio maritimus]
MQQVTRSALVMFSADQMFNLVNDVASYPDFLPGCSGSRVLEATNSAMVASVDVSKAGISKTFTTANTLVHGSEILMELVDGPFKMLKGVWSFIPLDDQACKVELKLEFEFSSKMIELAFGKIFHDVTSNMVNAFTKRAKEVYTYEC